MSRELELLKKLHEATTKLDMNFCTVTGRNDKSLAMSGEEYDEINDLLIEVEEFLKQPEVEKEILERKEFLSHLARKKFLLHTGLYVFEPKHLTIDECADRMSRISKYTELTDLIFHLPKSEQDWVDNHFEELLGQTLAEGSTE